MDEQHKAGEQAPTIIVDDRQPKQSNGVRQKAQQKPDTNDDPQWRRSHGVQKWMVTITAAYCLVTAGLFIQNGCHFQASQETAQKQFTESQDLTRANARNAQRAYLVFESATLDRPLREGQGVFVRFVLRNTGITPALEVWTDAKFWLVPKDEAARSGPVAIGPGSGVPTMDIGAGQPVSVVLQQHPPNNPRTTIPLSADEVRAITLADKRLFVAGAATYVDVFMPSPRPPNVAPDAATFTFEYVLKAPGNIDNGSFEASSNSFNMIRPNIPVTNKRQ